MKEWLSITAGPTQRAALAREAHDFVAGDEHAITR